MTIDEGIETAPLAPTGEPLLAATVPEKQYELLKQIGCGAMGEVWTARQAGLNRVVALKMIVASYRKESKALIRFLAEAEAVAAVQHPNVVQVFDYGHRDGRPFLAMEYVSGGTLGDFLRSREGMNSRDAAMLLEKIARGVAAAHSQGIVHRDLKPGNVLLDGMGEPKVADFGLAKRGTGTDLTATGAIMGTPAYMAPEQATGRAKFVLPSADVWALGVILYECLTGSRPFDGPDTWAILHAVQHENPVPLRKVKQRTPRDLELICMKCLAKEPGDRYPTAAELADDLLRFTVGDSIAARPVSPIGQLTRWAKKNKSLATGMGVAIAALVLGTLISTREAIRATNAEVETTRQLELTQSAESSAIRERDNARNAESKAIVRERQEKEARSDAERQKRAAEDRLYVADMRLAQQDWGSKNLSRLGRTLDAYGPLPPATEVRGFEWYYWQSRARPERLRLDGYKSLSVKYSEDGKWLAAHFPGVKNELHIIDARDGSVSLRIKDVPSRGYLAFSPDGSKIAAVGGVLIVWDLPSGRERFRITGRTVPFFSLAFSPDGKHLVTSSEQWNRVVEGGPIEVWDLSTGSRLRDLDFPKGSCHKLAFSPAGRWLAGAAADGTVRLWDAGSWKAGVVLGTPAPPGYGQITDVRSVAFSPDGKNIAAITLAHVITVSETTTWNEVRRSPPIQGQDWSFSICYTENSREIITSDGDYNIHIWDASSLQLKTTLRGHLHEIFDLAIRPRSNEVASASADGTVRVWDLDAALQKVRVKEESGAVQYFTGDPVGRFAVDPTARRRFAMAGPNGVVRIWDLDEPHDPQQFDGHTGDVFDVSFNRSGTFLASASRDGTARVWDTRKGTEIAVCRGHIGSVRGVALSPSGEKLATVGEDGCVRVWNWANGQGRVLYSITGSPGGEGAITWSPDGRLLATKNSHGPTVRVWSAEDGQPMGKPEGHTGNVWHFAFSPDSKWLASAGEDANVVVWDVANQKIAAIYKGHTSRVQSIAWSPDGQRLASAGLFRGGQIKVWYLPGGDPRNGQEILTLQPTCSHLGFTPDGKCLIGANPGTVYVWDTIRPPLRIVERAPKPHEFYPWKFGEPGLRADLYAGMKFERLIKTRVDTLLAWSQSPDSPSADPRLPTAQFSIRWSGFIRAPKPGRYRLAFFADDGVRVWVDDKLMIDAWKSPQVAWHECEVDLAARPQKIRMEYFQDAGGARYQLVWIPPGETNPVAIPSECLRTPGEQDPNGFEIAPPPRGR